MSAEAFAAADDADVGAREELDELYPGAWALGLIPVIGKRPLEHGWTTSARERYAGGSGRAEHVAAMAQHVADGRNLGLVVPPGVLVLDADSPEACDYLERLLPEAPRQESRPGRGHFVVRVPAELQISATAGREIAPGIEVDLRSAGLSQIVAAPSRHATGSVYRWLRPLPLDLAELTPCPPELLARVTGTDEARSPARERAGADERSSIREGGRNAALASLAGTMQRRGMSEAAIRAALLVENSQRCAPPLSEAEVLGIAASVSRYPAEGIAAHPMSDLGNAERFIGQHGGDLRYCPGLRSWLRWDGRRWARVERVHLDPMARETVRGILAEAHAEQDSDRRAALAKHAARAEAETRIRAMISLAPAVPGVLVEREALDADPNVVNCENGVLELDTDTLRPHCRGDLLTRLAPVHYDPGARSEEWERVLEHALPEEEERAFFARAVGYTLGGAVTHDAVFFAHGPTGSSKSTILGAIEAALGDYAASCEFSTFLRRADVGGTQPGLAKLPGARMALCNEVEPGRAFNVGLLKAFSAGDTLTCHGKYEPPFTFRPLARLWLVANDRPEVSHTDSAVWRRLLVVPFERAVSEPDEGLKARLRDPAKCGAAVVGWAMRGRRDWLARGRRLDPPACVVAASLAYRASQNPLGGFVADACRLTPHAWTSTSALRSGFERWNGGKPLSERTFTDALRALGLEAAKRSHARGWAGIELLLE